MRARFRSELSGVLLMLLALPAEAEPRSARARPQTETNTGAAAGAPEVPPEGMSYIPAGEFTMGSRDDDSWAEKDEFPQRVVYLPAYYIDEIEISNLEYKKFLDATGWKPPPSWREGRYTEGTEFIPVTDVTWWDATAYARWVGKRLPTEAEWEKASRGTDGRRFPWGNEFEPDNANNDKTVLPVGSKPTGASPYGPVDMAGNVAEWTASMYGPYPRIEPSLPGAFGGENQPPAQGATPATFDASTVAVSAVPLQAGGRPPKIHEDDPRLAVFPRAELQDTRPRVYRGGSYNSYARFLRCTDRQMESPNARWPNLGFRCARDAPPTNGKRP